MQLRMHIQGNYTAAKSSKSIKIECYIVANIKSILYNINISRCKKIIQI